ncbi:hypothetical protein G4B88_031118 [Cannabis sativa]|uniref:Uncharacterized protein n=1 Tax=Cannabis sativa TaxID=3483 RepID=A0A7J6GSS2_CANSA|nr:hypothetical protein G4B88_031118 [Cannabis sativa]
MLSTQFESINPVFRVGIRFRRDGFFDYNPNICCGGHNCISSGQNLLQQNPFHQFASPDIGCHSSSMLLDDVGDCLPRADETANSSNPQ